MGLPIIPSTTQDQSYIDIMESIALEETAIAHIINAEGEKVQATATLMNLGEMTPNEVVKFQKGVAKVIQVAIKMQMLLEFKLDTILDAITNTRIIVHQNIGTVTAEFEGITYTDSDLAYYYTKEVGTI